MPVYRRISQAEMILESFKRDTLQERDGSPKIGGSVGGFIALVVCLCLVIAVSCTAIFLLLRARDPSDSERAQRRQRRLKENAKYPAASEPWTSKIRHIFSSGKPASSNARGWIQAGSGDEWESQSLEGQPRMRDMEMAYSQQTDSPYRPPFHEAESSTTTRFDDSELKIPKFASPSSSPSDTPPRVSSPEQLSRSSLEAERPERHKRHSSSTQSSNHTFISGTKFIESL